MIFSKYYTVFRIGGGRFMCSGLFVEGWHDQFGIIAPNLDRAKGIARSIVNPVV